MVILCDTCSILMLIRIAPNMFSDPEFGAVTIPNVAREFTGTQKFKSKYPWRSEYRSHVVPVASSAMQDDDYILILELVKQMLENGIVDAKTDRLFDLSAVDSFHPEILFFRMLKLMVFFPETRSFFFWQGNQAIMRRRILIR